MIETKHLVCLDCDPKSGTEAWVKRHRTDRDQAIHMEITPEGLSYGIHIVDVVSNICMLPHDQAVKTLLRAHSLRKSEYPPHASHIPMLENEASWGLHSERPARTLYLGREVGWSSMDAYETLDPCLCENIIVQYADYANSASKTRKKGEPDNSTLIHQLVDTTPGVAGLSDDLYTRECMYLLGRHLWETELKQVTGRGFDRTCGVTDLDSLSSAQKKQITGLDAMIRDSSIPMDQYFQERRRKTRTPYDVLEDTIYDMKAHRLNEILMLSVAEQLKKYFFQNGIPLLYSSNGDTPLVRTASDTGPVGGTPSLTAPLRNWTGLINQLNLVHFIRTGQPLLDMQGLAQLIPKEDENLEDVYRWIVSTMQSI